ncbi:MAG: hypothetical protein HY293_14750 [Planctomycetes bacterium]|nr:hypothetical protein [Planctomycetota bacterium]
MAIQLIGGGGGDVPFNRTFFNVALGEMIEKSGKEKAVRLTLFLSDGTTLDVCVIDQMSDGYLALRAYQGDSEQIDESVHLIPYGLIYRIEVSPRDEQNSRLGFQWKPVAKKAVTTRRTK